MSIARDLARLRTPAQVAYGGTGKTTEFRKGFIDGLRYVSKGDNAITITAGAAYIPSLGKIVELSADKALTGIAALAARSQHHFYLYENNGVGDVEISLTAPQSYYGSAYQKTGDPSRRYLFSVLSGTTGFYPMYHELETGRMNFTTGAPASPPFIVTTFGGTTPTLVDVVISNSGANSLAPRETTTRLFTIVSTSVAGLFVATSPADQAVIPAPSNWGFTTGGAGSAGAWTLDVRPSRTAPSVGNYYVWASGTSGQFTMYAIGYAFER